MILKNKYQNLSVITPPRIFIACDTTTKIKAFELLKTFFDKEIFCGFDYECKSFKSQFRLANKLGCRYVIILGGNELSNNIVKLKDFADGSEQEIIIENIIDELNYRLRSV